MAKVLRIFLALAVLVVILCVAFLLIFFFAVPTSTTAVTTPIQGMQSLLALGVNPPLSWPRVFPF